MLDTGELALEAAEPCAGAPRSFELYLEIDVEDMPDARDVLEQIAERVSERANGLRLVSHGVRAASA